MSIRTRCMQAVRENSAGYAMLVQEILKEEPKRTGYPAVPGDGFVIQNANLFWCIIFAWIICTIITMIKFCRRTIAHRIEPVKENCSMRRNDSNLIPLAKNTITPVRSDQDDPIRKNNGNVLIDDTKTTLSGGSMGQGQ